MLGWVTEQALTEDTEQLLEMQKLWMQHLVLIVAVFGGAWAEIAPPHDTGGTCETVCAGLSCAAYAPLTCSYASRVGYRQCPGKPSKVEPPGYFETKALSPPSSELDG